MVVYLFLMAFLVIIPLAIARVLLFSDLFQEFMTVLGSTTKNHPPTLYLTYLVSEVQLPLELLLIHVAFLSLLDKKKDRIGHCLHQWVVTMCAMLGLTRYVVPLPIIINKNTRLGPGRGSNLYMPINAHATAHYNAETNALHVVGHDANDPLRGDLRDGILGDKWELDGHSPGRPGRRNIRGRGVQMRGDGGRVRGVGSGGVGSGGVEGVDGVEGVGGLGGVGSIGVAEEPARIHVGDPLPRPPPGWDVRTPRSSSRWAWGLEQPSETEMMVAPRVTPSWCFLRVTVLLVISLATVNALAVFVLIVPVLVGRAVMCSFPILSGYLHDPFNFLVGLTFLQPVLSLLLWAIKDGLSAVRAWRVPFFVVRKAAFIVLNWLLLELMVGAIQHNLPSPHQWPFFDGSLTYNLMNQFRNLESLDMQTLTHLSHKDLYRLIVYMTFPSDVMVHAPKPSLITQLIMVAQKIRFSQVIGLWFNGAVYLVYYNLPYYSLYNIPPILIPYTIYLHY